MRGVLLAVVLGLMSSLAAAEPKPLPPAPPGGSLAPAPPAGSLPPAPDWTGDAWLNSEPLRLSELRGKVVLVEFWTFGCWNCKNVEPQLRDWHARYADQGLVTVGIHTPEFSHERVVANVKTYVAENDIGWPVLIDNGFRTWRRYGNRYWPAFYLIDKQGRIRHRRIGEGGAAEMESWIRRLLAE